MGFRSDLPHLGRRSKDPAALRSYWSVAGRSGRTGNAPPANCIRLPFNNHGDPKLTCFGHLGAPYAGALQPVTAAVILNSASKEH